MKTPRMSAVGLLLLLMIALPVHAQIDGASAGYDDYDNEVAEQEGAVYGRLRYLEGTVTLQRNSQIITDLVINDPLTPGDVFVTGPEGRGEIQLADGSSLRLDYDTELVLQSLSDNASQIQNTTILQLVSGSLMVRADDMDSNEKRFQIDTDEASIFLLSDGLYRIDVRPDGATVVLSRRGAAEVMAQDISSIVRSGERITVRPGHIPGEPQVFNTRLSDDFEQWCLERDDVLVRRAPLDEEYPAGLPEPVEPYADELSYYGRWHSNPSYGWVWRPVGLASDWQPYLYGRWGYSPAGLVWVSYEPWGWAPFHYGRWEFLLGSGWVWIPGHVFSGAYVAWSVAPGYFGWCPIGYYNYPVSFSFNIGHHRTPWVYIRAHQLYDRRVHNAVIRDVHVIREIEKSRVVVRGHPRIHPRNVKASPRVAQELHRAAANRKELQLGESPGSRRMPFREHERQQQVVLNHKRTRGGEDRRGIPVARRKAGGSVPVVSSGPQVSVPRRKAMSPARPSSSQVEQDRSPGRAGGQRSRGAQSHAGRPTEQASSPGQGPNRGPRVRQEQASPAQAPNHRPRARQEQASPAQAPNRSPRVRQESVPERVVPRIIPRPQSSGQPRRQSGESSYRKVVRRPELSVHPSRNSAGGPRPNAQPRSGHERGGASGGGRPAQPQPQKQSKGGGKGQNPNKKGGRD